MECAQCGSAIDQASAFCPRCGAPAGQRSSASSTDEAAIRPLLARAQLHKSRREYPQAIAQCMEALEQQPGSAAALSLLGDVEQAQGHLREAAEWYKQAVAADPGNASDRRKLDEVIDRLYVADAGAPAGGAAEGVRQRPGGRGLPWVPVVIASAALIIVVIAMVGWLRLTSSPEVSVRIASPGAASPSASTGLRASPPPTPSRPAARPASAAEPAAAGFLDERERRAAEAAVSALEGREPAVSVAPVFIRPDNNQVELTLNLAAEPAAAGRRASVLRAALTAVQAVNRADAALKSFSVRVRAPIAAASGPSHAEVVFMGELAAVAVAGRDIGALSAADAEALFTQTWWRSGWAPGATTETEGRP
jgi:tetratricopeptide (TPR) repeat protein